MAHIPAFSPIPGPLLRALGLDIQEAANPSAHRKLHGGLSEGVRHVPLAGGWAHAPSKRDSRFPDRQSGPYEIDGFLLPGLLIFQEMPELCSFA